MGNKAEEVECACGCGQTRKKIGAGGRQCRYINGHNFGIKKPGRKKWRGNDAKYRKWRRQVIQRDQNVCRACGNKATDPVAHHIKPWVKSEEARYDLDNGVCLCRWCHYLVHDLVAYE